MHNLTTELDKGRMNMYTKGLLSCKKVSVFLKLLRHNFANFGKLGSQLEVHF